jgi:hypothetical protein
MLVATNLHYLIHWPTQGGYNFVSGPLADITLVTAFAGTLRAPEAWRRSRGGDARGRPDRSRTGRYLGGGIPSIRSGLDNDRTSSLRPADADSASTAWRSYPTRRLSRDLLRAVRRPYWHEDERPSAFAVEAATAAARRNLSAPSGSPSRVSPSPARCRCLRC